MKKNSTLVIFFLLLAAVIFYASSVFLYQGSLSRINDDLRVKRVEIFERNKEIESLNLNVTKLLSAIELQEKREANLSSQFLDVRDEKVDLEAQKVKLGENIKTKDQEITSLKSQITTLNSKISDYIADIELKKETISSITKDVESICDKAESLNITKCNKYD
jgi:chromosome segregation ATPase